MTIGVERSTAAFARADWGRDLHPGHASVAQKAQAVAHQWISDPKWKAGQKEWAAAGEAAWRAHLPKRTWVHPPAPTGEPGRHPGGFTAVGITNTRLGDAVEHALAQHLGMTTDHPDRRQGPMDLRFGDHAYEVKAVTTSAREYKAKPKAREVQEKLAYAAEHGLVPHTMVVVYHPGERQLYVYSKLGIGAYRLTNETNGWEHHGTVPLDLGPTADPAAHPDQVAAAVRADWGKDLHPGGWIPQAKWNAGEAEWIAKGEAAWKGHVHKPLHKPNYLTVDKAKAAATHIQLKGGHSVNEDLHQPAPHASLARLGRYAHRTLHSEGEWWSGPGDRSYGAVTFDDHGRVLLREPTNHFGGAWWTFPKGHVDFGESPAQAALRETAEETGHYPTLVDHLPGKGFQGTTGRTFYYLAHHGPTAPPFNRFAAEENGETQALTWASPQAAWNLMEQSTPSVRYRDQQVLKAAVDRYSLAHPELGLPSLPEPKAPAAPPPVSYKPSTSKLAPGSKLPTWEPPPGGAKWAGASKKSSKVQAMLDALGFGKKRSVDVEYSRADWGRDLTGGSVSQKAAAVASGMTDTGKGWIPQPDWQEGQHNWASKGEALWKAHEWKPGAGGEGGRAFDQLHPTVQQHIAAVAHQAVHHAVANQPKVRPMLEHIAMVNGGEMTGLEHAVKTPHSLQDKIVEKMTDSHAAGHGMSPYEAIHAIHDVHRYTMLFTPEHYAQGVRQAVTELHQKGYQFPAERIKNTWGEGNIYRGLNTTMIAPTGEHIELQFHTPESFATKQSQHADYEVARSPSASPTEVAAANERMKAKGAAVFAPPGASTLSREELSVAWWARGTMGREVLRRAVSPGAPDHVQGGWDHRGDVFRQATALDSLPPIRDWSALGLDRGRGVAGGGGAHRQRLGDDGRPLFVRNVWGHDLEEQQAQQAAEVATKAAGHPYGYIPKPKWQEGQQEWVQHGEAAWAAHAKEWGKAWGHQWTGPAGHSELWKGAKPSIEQSLLALSKHGAAGEGNGKSFPEAAHAWYAEGAQQGYHDAAKDHLDSVQITAKAAPWYVKAKTARAKAFGPKADETTAVHEWAHSLGMAHGIAQAAADKRVYEKAAGIKPHAKQPGGKGKKVVNLATAEPEVVHPSEVIAPQPEVVNASSSPAPLTHTANPHVPGTHESQAWEHGYAAAREAAGSMTPEQVKNYHSKVQFEVNAGHYTATPVIHAMEAGIAAGYADHLQQHEEQPPEHPKPSPVELANAGLHENPHEPGSEDWHAYEAGYKELDHHLYGPTAPTNDMQVHQLEVGHNTESAFTQGALKAIDHYKEAHAKEVNPESVLDQNQQITKSVPSEPKTVEEVGTWKKVEGPHGSNPSQWYESPSGQQYLLKSPPNPALAENEVAMGKVYEQAGVHVPHTTLLHGTFGGAHVLSRKVEGPGSDESLSKWTGTPEQIAEARKGYGIDALTANWDVGGLVKDNVMVGKDGHIVRVDVGGAGAFRAQGNPKPNWGPGQKMVEHKSLLEPGSQGEWLYGHATGTEPEMLASLHHAAHLTLTAVGQKMKAAGVSDEHVNHAIATLASRQGQIKDYLAEKGYEPGAHVEPSSSAAEVPAEAESAPTAHAANPMAKPEAALNPIKHAPDWVPGTHLPTYAEGATAGYNEAKASGMTPSQLKAAITNKGYKKSAQLKAAGDLEHAAYYHGFAHGYAQAYKESKVPAVEPSVSEAPEVHPHQTDAFAKELAVNQQSAHGVYGLQLAHGEVTPAKALEEAATHEVISEQHHLAGNHIVEAEHIGAALGIKKAVKEHQEGAHDVYGLKVTPAQAKQALDAYEAHGGQEGQGAAVDGGGHYSITDALGAAGVADVGNDKVLAFATPFSDIKHALEGIVHPKGEGAPPGTTWTPTEDHNSITTVHHWEKQPDGTMLAHMKSGTTVHNNPGDSKETEKQLEQSPVWIKHKPGAPEPTAEPSTSMSAEEKINAAIGKAYEAGFDYNGTHDMAKSAAEGLLAQDKLNAAQSFHAHAEDELAKQLAQGLGNYEGIANAHAIYSGYHSALEEAHQLPGEPAKTSDAFPKLEVSHPEADSHWALHTGPSVDTEEASDYDWTLQKLQPGDYVKVADETPETPTNEHESAHKVVSVTPNNQWKFSTEHNNTIHHWMLPQGDSVKAQLGPSHFEQSSSPSPENPPTADHSKIEHYLQGNSLETAKGEHYVKQFISGYNQVHKGVVSGGLTPEEVKASIETFDNATHNSYATSLGGHEGMVAGGKAALSDLEHGGFWRPPQAHIVKQMIEGEQKPSVHNASASLKTLSANKGVSTSNTTWEEDQALKTTVVHDLQPGDVIKVVANKTKAHSYDPDGEKPLHTLVSISHDGDVSKLTTATENGALHSWTVPHDVKVKSFTPEPLPPMANMPTPPTPAPTTGNVTVFGAQFTHADAQKLHDYLAQHWKHTTVGSAAQQTGVHPLTGKLLSQSQHPAWLSAYHNVASGSPTDDADKVFLNKLAEQLGHPQPSSGSASANHGTVTVFGVQFTHPDAVALAQHLADEWHQNSVETIAHQHGIVPVHGAIGSKYDHQAWEDAWNDGGEGDSDKVFLDELEKQLAGSGGPTPHVAPSTSPAPHVTAHHYHQHAHEITAIPEQHKTKHQPVQFTEDMEKSGEPYHQHPGYHNAVYDEAYNAAKATENPQADQIAQLEQQLKGMPLGSPEQAALAGKVHGMKAAFDTWAESHKSEAQKQAEAAYIQKVSDAYHGTPFQFVVDPTQTLGVPEQIPHGTKPEHATQASTNAYDQSIPQGYDQAWAQFLQGATAEQINGTAKQYLAKAEEMPVNPADETSVIAQAQMAGLAQGAGKAAVDIKHAHGNHPNASSKSVISQGVIDAKTGKTSYSGYHSNNPYLDNQSDTQLHFTPAQKSVISRWKATYRESHPNAPFIKALDILAAGGTPGPTDTEGANKARQMLDLYTEMAKPNHQSFQRKLSGGGIPAAVKAALTNVGGEVDIPLTSWSTDPAAWSGDWIIHAPAGSVSMDIGKISGLPHEVETISGGRFRIEKVEVIGGKTHIYVTQVQSFFK